MTVAQAEAAALGASELERALDLEAECTRLLALEEDLFEVSFWAPEMARRARPGEFAQIWTGPDHLRRPFSFSRADPERGTVSFYIGAVGRVTRRLRRLREGEPVRLLGPLGRGFSLPQKPGRSLLLAGGLGAAPFPLLADWLLGRGEAVVWLNGARSPAQLYPPELLPPGLAARSQVTEDGSLGRAARVTEALPAELSQFHRVYACGPNPMLAALWERLSSGSAAGRLEVSIEAPMGCGFGTCLGCAVPLPSEGAGYALCCRQGPVFPAGSLDWERLRRQPAHLE